MPDSIADSIRWWSDFRAQQPVRDAQLADWAEALGERKQAFQQGLKTESTLGKFLGDALAPGSALAPTPAPPPSDTGSAQTYPLPSPQPIVGTQQPLVPPGSPSTAPAPGQASTPMQPPNMASLLPQHSQQFLSQQPPQARQAALMALLADMMKKKVTTTAPGAPTGPAPAMGAPAPQGPAGAPSTPPAPAAPAGAPAGWSPMPKPMTGEGVRGADEGGPSVGGRAIDPAKMPSVSTLVQRMKAGGVDPITMYEAVRDYSKMEDQESKKALAAARIEAEVYRSMVSAGNARMRALASQEALEDRRAAREARSGPGSSRGATGEGGGLLSDDQKKFYAAMQIGGDSSWRTGLSRNKNGAEMILEVDKYVPELAKEWGLSAGEVGTNKAKRAGLVYALRQRENFVAAGNQYVQNLQSQADLVEKYMTAGVAGGVPAINRWIQAGRKSIGGDPDVVALDTAIRGLAREHQRIVTGVTSNAQLHVAAQQTADELLNKDMTAAQIRATIKVMREEANNAIAAGRKEIGEVSDEITSLTGPKSSQSSGNGSGSPLRFKTEAEAANANLKKGTRVIINGVSGTWQ